MRPVRPTLALAVAVLLVAAACSAEDDGDGSASDTTGGGTAATAPPSPAAADPTLEARDCDPEEVADVPDGVTVECSWLVVPVDREEPSAGDLRLAVRLLPSTATDPAPDPLVFVSGGPGAPGGEASFWAAQPFLSTRDVVLWDQRGTGRSEPDMDCPEAEPALVELFTTDRSHAEDREALGAAYQACHDRLADEGVDLASFTTPDSAADLADLRVALGYDEWNVYGLSYGTRLAMEAMRSHPEGIRSVVLDSPYPMDVGTVGQAVDGAQHGIDRLVEGCAADPTCAEAHPDLAGEVDAIVERYDAEPYRSTIDLADGGATEIVFRGDDLVGGFYDAIYGHSLIPALPTAVGSIAAGDGTIIDAVAAESIPLQAGGAEAMGHLVDCADAGPLRDADPGADQEFLDDPGRWGTTVLLVTWAWCDIWDDGAVDAAFVEPVTADVPVLVLSGTYDPATPTPGAQEVADALPDATLVTFEGHGHGLWNDSECAIDLADRFVTDPGAPLDTSCAEAIEPPAFG